MECSRHKLDVEVQPQATHAVTLQIRVGACQDPARHEYMVDFNSISAVCVCVHHIQTRRLLQVVYVRENKSNMGE